MMTLREHQQMAARAPRGTKGRPATPRQAAVRRVSIAKARRVRLEKISRQALTPGSDRV